MVLTLTILTGGAVTVLLVALIVALRFILQHLASIGESLDKIAMGVRAIEVETAPLIPRIEKANETFTELKSGLDLVGKHLSHADTTLEAAATILGSTK